MHSLRLFRLHHQNALRVLPLVMHLLHLLLKEEFVSGYRLVTNMSNAPLRRATHAAAGLSSYRAASSGVCYSGNGICCLYVGDSRMRLQPEWGVRTPQQKHSALVAAAPSFWGNNRHSAWQSSSAAGAATSAFTDQAAALVSALAGPPKAAAAATRAGATAAGIADKLQPTPRSTTILTRQWSAFYGQQPQAAHSDQQRRFSSLPHAPAAAQQAADAAAGAAPTHSLQQRRTLVTEVRTLEDFEEVRKQAPGASPAASSPSPPAAGGGAAATAAASPLRVVQFSASWCGPCKRIAPVVQKMSEEWPSDKVRFYHVDIDDNPALAEEYNVTTVPTFFFFKNGQVVNSISGSNAKALQDAISKFTDN